MCGICGVVASDPSHPWLMRGTLETMRDSMVHRGPDDAGSYIDSGVALGSRRLSIIDLSANGHMPMRSPDGRYVIVYNGEIFNYLGLRQTLEGKGPSFRSNTDTEVVLRLYQEHGPAMLEKLNGMFAIAIWDARERELFLARDRLGVKPVYYHLAGDCFAFASEAKALLVAGVSPEFDPAHWEEMLCFRYVSGENTPFKEIRRLLPGHWLTWKAGRLQGRRWWNLGAIAKARAGEGAGERAERWYAETFDDAVEKRLISDVPVGVLLSGGLDSSSVAASIGLSGHKQMASFTVRFDEPQYDEGELAREVASRWGLDYRDIKLPPAGLPDQLREATWFNDEPLVHGNELQIRAISAYAKQYVSVLLSGEGSDETLGGYVRHQPLRMPAVLAGAKPLLPGLGRLLPLPSRARKLARFLALGDLDRLVLFNACDVLPGDLEELGFRAGSDFPFREAMLEEAQSVYPQEPVRQVMYCDQHTFLCSILERNDKMTMAASIECRVPFLDHRLVEGVAALPSRALFPDWRTKPLLRRALGSRLPASVQRHRKWGFGVPWQRYLRDTKPLKELLLAMPDREPIKSSPFDRKKLRSAVQDFLTGDDSKYMLLRQLVNVGIWFDRFCADGRLAARVSVGQA